LAVAPCFVKRSPDTAQTLPMDEKPPLPSKEERLAAKLRENLRKRKEQAREINAALPKDKPGS
jgi:hypothetical protein